MEAVSSFQNGKGEQNEANYFGLRVSPEKGTAWLFTDALHSHNQQCRRNCRAGYYTGGGCHVPGTAEGGSGCPAAW